LLFSDPAYGDFSLKIIFAADRRARQATQERNLSHVCERVGNRALEDFLGGVPERRI
jgi:hypothetical protein